MMQQLKNQGLLIATHNAGKLKEIQALLAPLGIHCSSAAEHQLPEPEETGNSFAENAMLKSAAAFRATNIPSLADDSGLVIPALGGAPGIYSARWAEKDGGRDFNHAFGRIQRELVERDAAMDSPCYFVCMLSLALAEPVEISLPKAAQHAPYSIQYIEQGGVHFYNIEGRAYGTLTFPARGPHGFGYDPIFIPSRCSETFAEMPAEKKQRMSHRAHAFQGFLKVIEG